MSTPLIALQGVSREYRVGPQTVRALNGLQLHRWVPPAKRNREREKIK